MTALVNWLTNYGQVILFFAQLIYWLVVGAACIAAIWAVLIFNRYVNARVSRWAEESPEKATPVAAPVEKPSIEEFVD